MREGQVPASCGPFKYDLLAERAIKIMHWAWFCLIFVRTAAVERTLPLQQLGWVAQMHVFGTRGEPGDKARVRLPRETSQREPVPSNPP